MQQTLWQIAVIIPHSNCLMTYPVMMQETVAQMIYKLEDVFSTMCLQLSKSLVLTESLALLEHGASHRHFL